MRQTQQIHTQQLQMQCTVGSINGGEDVPEYTANYLFVLAQGLLSIDELAGWMMGFHHTGRIQKGG